MLWLASDTSSAQGGLALFDGEKNLARKTWRKDGSHSEYITVAFQELLKEVAFATDDLEFLAVGTGPGSFTGIRVAINFMRSLGYALNKPVLNLNSLHLLALQPGLSSGRPVRILQYAFRNFAYSAEYEITSTVTETLTPKALTPDEIAKSLTKETLVIGTGYDALKSHFSSETLKLMVRDSQFADLPNPENFVSLLKLDQHRAHLTDWIHTIPLYIRASEAEEKLKNGLLKPL